MPWAKIENRVVKQSGQIVTVEACCCLVPCPCPPEFDPLEACIFGDIDTRDYDGQKIWFSHTAEQGEECRRMTATFTPWCCPDEVVANLVWPSQFGTYPDDLRLLVSVGGGPETEYSPSIATCDPFCIVFPEVSPGTCSGLMDIRINCQVENTCYCPPEPGKPFPESIIGFFRANGCDFDGQFVTLQRMCHQSGECEVYGNHCFTLAGCTPEQTMSIEAIWKDPGTDHTDIELRWKLEPSSVWNVVSPSDPPSQCDPFCLLFDNVPTIASVAPCCDEATNPPQFVIGDCPIIVTCCCPQFEGAAPDPMDVTITGGFSGFGQIWEEYASQPGACAAWRTDPDNRTPVTPVDPGNCAAQDVDIEIWCPAGSTSPNDLRMSIDIEPTQYCGGPTNMPPTTATCGPPLSVSWTFTVDDGFVCICGSVTVTLTIPGEAAFSTGFYYRARVPVAGPRVEPGPPRPIPPEAVPPPDDEAPIPPEVTEWLDEDQD